MNDNMDAIGQVADTLDNLAAALQLPVDPEIHVKALRKSLPEAAKVLKNAVIAETGENPWTDYEPTTGAEQ